MKMTMFVSGGDFKGAYSPSTLYRINDIVRYNGAAYITIADNVMGVLPTDLTKWRVMVDKVSTPPLSAETVTTPSSSVTGNAVGTRKYWFGLEWSLSMPSNNLIRLNKIYRNCNCNCQYTQACNCQVNQPNCGNCSWDKGDGLACNCACLFQSNCNCFTGYCNCTAQCNDGNCFI